MNNKKTVISIAVILVVGFAFAALAYKWSRDEKVKKVISDSPSVLERASAKSLGPADAKVTIVEFMDPGCETCRAFHPFVKKLLEENPGKVRLTVRYLPLHQGADTMVKILEAADKQGMYWDTLHLMFATQPMWASHHHPQPEKIWPMLPKAGLDVEAIRRDMESPEIAAILEKDMADAERLGIRKTPSFFVNGKPLTEFGYDQLRALVDDAVASSY